MSSASGLIPCRGALAICGKGHLGVIECDEPQVVTYPDGTTGLAWIGRHVADGRPWSSRNPTVIGHVSAQHRDSA